MITSKIHIIYQSTYFIEYFILNNFKYSGIKKIHQVLGKIRRIDQKHQKSIVSCYHMNYCLQKFTTHQFTYFIYYLFQKKFKYPKNDVNPTSTSGDTCKTIFIYFIQIVFYWRLI